MPIDDDNNLVNRGPTSINVTTAIDELTPPQYGNHQFDQLYSDIDPTGYMTPAGGPSGLNTPFQSRSRSVSSENLTSLNGVASSNFAANTLQSRLSNLDVAGPSRVTRDRNLDRSQLSCSGDGQTEQGDESGTSLSRGGYFGNGGNQQALANGNTVSRRGSGDDDVTSGPVTPLHIEHSGESLSKVPSYTTALQSQTRTPVNDGLPTYQSATRGPVQTPPMPPVPRQVCGQLPIHSHRDILRRCS